MIATSWEHTEKQWETPCTCQSSTGAHQLQEQCSIDQFRIPEAVHNHVHVAINVWEKCAMSKWVFRGSTENVLKAMYVPELIPYLGAKKAVVEIKAVVLEIPR